MTGRIDPRSVLALAAAVLLWLAGPAAAETATGDVQLSDAWLTAKTKLALLADEDVSGSSINVDTSSAVVTLKGEVEDQAQKARALQIARGIEGVKQVQDHLTIKPTRSGSASTAQGGATTAPGASGVAKRDDDQIERDVRQAIQKSWTSGQLRMDGDTLKGAEGTSIEVDVDDGVVTLDGKVQSVEDIVKAAQAARGVQGVRSVKTNIESGQPS
jgi:hyperosmotically inducible protein